MKPKGKKHGETPGADRNRQTELERSHALGMQLLRNIKTRLPELEKLLEKVWSYGDGRGTDFGACCLVHNCLACSTGSHWMPF